MQEKKCIVESIKNEINYAVFYTENTSLCTFSFLVVDIRMKYFSSYLLKTSIVLTFLMFYKFCIKWLEKFECWMIW